MPAYSCGLSQSKPVVPSKRLERLHARLARQEAQLEEQEALVKTLGIVASQGRSVDPRIKRRDGLRKQVHETKSEIRSLEYIGG
jgi:hypothetical protein